MSDSPADVPFRSLTTGISMSACGARTTRAMTATLSAMPSRSQSKPVRHCRPTNRCASACECGRARRLNDRLLLRQVRRDDSGQGDNEFSLLSIGLAALLDVASLVGGVTPYLS